MANELYDVVEEELRYGFELEWLLEVAVVGIGELEEVLAWVEGIVLDDVVDDELVTLPVAYVVVVPADAVMEEVGQRPPGTFRI